ncbi:MAG: hypothetical protein OXS47_14570 [Chloroflexota bacterium]|nr:hypothetical protein [Chloroflexota bacterium]
MAKATEKKRLTLDLDAPLQRRLKAVAALKGISMREYCQTAIEKELEEDEAEEAPDDWSHLSNAEYFARVRKQFFGDRTLPGNSVDLIREAREIRDAQLNATLKDRP